MISPQLCSQDTWSCIRRLRMCEFIVCKGCSGKDKKNRQIYARSRSLWHTVYVRKVFEASNDRGVVGSRLMLKDTLGIQRLKNSHRLTHQTRVKNMTQTAAWQTSWRIEAPKLVGSEGTDRARQEFNLSSAVSARDSHRILTVCWLWAITLLAE